MDQTNSDGRKITFLPTAPIRYNGSTPSMSRRGGIRLHPVADGTLNMHTSVQYLRTRDRMGQKLRDHTDPETGMFTHTSSLIESSVNYGVRMDEPVNAPVNGNPTGTLRYLPATVRLDEAGRRVYLDEAGRRIRTTDMGEAPIAAVPPKTTGSTGSKPVKRRRNVDARASKSGARAVPGATGAGGRITDADIEAYVIALGKSKGVTITVVTPSMMRDGREALKLVRLQAAKALAKADSRAASQSRAGK